MSAGSTLVTGIALMSAQVLLVRVLEAGLAYLVVDHGRVHPVG
jgi:hypothetical protein